MLKKERGREFSLNQAFVIIIFIFEVILVFTFFDYVFHTLSPDYSVPSWYFTNKIIYGTLIGFVTYLFVRKKSIMQKSLILSAVVSILLQVRYYFRDYAINFVILFLIIHFVILFIVSYLGMKITKI